MKSIKKILSAVLAAALCITAVVAIPASAAKKTVWQESKELAGAKYNSKYITWVEKYSEKDSKTTVTYSKSRTKKLMDKLAKAAEKDTPQFSYSTVSKDYILHVAVKGDKFKAVVYTGIAGMAYSGNSSKITFLDINDKEKCTLKISDLNVVAGYDDFTAAEFVKSAAKMFYLDIESDYKAEVMKFTSGGKTYYYEKFNDYLGFLFNESGTALAANINGDVVCLTVSYKVDDKAFDIPTGYKNADFEDIDWL